MVNDMIQMVQEMVEEPSHWFDPMCDMASMAEKPSSWVFSPDPS